MIYRILISSVLLLVISCSGNIQPKPKAFLRLEYPEPTYDTIKEYESGLSPDESHHIYHL